MIAEVNTGGANLASVGNALVRLQAEYVLTDDAQVIAQAERVILPGVGAAANAMARLERAGLVDTLKQLTQPTLGIRLGMQLLFEASEEGDVPCLGVIPGVVRPMATGPGISIPHMGWNRVSPVGSGSALLERDDGYFYFVHSYQAPAGEHVRAVTDHGAEVPAIVEHNNFVGTQFHPERSANSGARLLEAFIKS